MSGGRALGGAGGARLSGDRQP